MNLLEREILEIDANVFGIRLRNLLAQRLGFFFAVRALEIAEHHQHHGSSRSSKTRRQAGLQLVEIFLEWILRQIVNVSSNDFLTVPGNIKRFVLRAWSVDKVNIHLFEA